MSALFGLKKRHMIKGFFITGTDTGVGKTIIAGALILIIRSLGLRVCGMKPIETGCMKSKLKVQSSKLKVKEEVLIPSDGMFLKETANMDDSIDVITPIRLEKPLAPFPSSEIEGIPVDIEKIKKAYAELAKKYDAVVVEGIGGLLVPIKQDYFVLDLAKDFGLPIIIVSRPGLGTINHTLLTVNYAMKEGLNVAGIILNYSRPPENTLAEETNPKVIRQISPVPILGIFPYIESRERVTLEKTAIKSLDTGRIKKYLF
jgi:dethiobiotin synthetase